MRSLFRGFALMYALVTSQSCVLPEVELTPDTASSAQGEAVQAQDAGRSSPVAASGSGEGAASDDESTSPGAPPQAGAGPQQSSEANGMVPGAAAAMPMMPESGAETPAMSAPMTAKPPGGFKAVCDINTDCQAKLLCHKGLCKRDNGEACEEDGECAFESCFRTCRAALPAGGVCDSDDDCVSPSLCVMNTCRHRNGLSCSSNYQCASGSCVSKYCVEPEARTGPCQSEANCKSDLVCLQFRDGSPAPYCEQKGLFPPGALCKANTDCHSGTCSQSVCDEPTE
jgi:hypothetical protein